jgi:UDP-N-acetylglucosamine 2-epimerase (non-hydrolysing)
MQENQTLTEIVERSVRGFDSLLKSEKPDIVLVQGDTTTAFMGALIAFYNKIPVGHIEAGLRTWNIHSPFPEEANRSMISCLTTHHFTPTEGNKENLIKSGIPESRIMVTGNTVIDSLYYTLENNQFRDYSSPFKQKGEKLILLTAHRRENFGLPLENICQAVLDIYMNFPDVSIVYPVHLNPNVQKPVHEILGGCDRIYLIPPVDYQKMCTLMSDSYLIMTDSGGIQEEAPSLGKPVVVMREETERPEAVEAGTVIVSGTTREGIFQLVSDLLSDNDRYLQMANAVNPYGNGKAAHIIIDFLLNF